MKAYLLSCYYYSSSTLHFSLFIYQYFFVDVFFVIYVIVVLGTLKDNKKRIGKDDKAVKNSYLCNGLFNKKPVSDDLK